MFLKLLETRKRFKTTTVVALVNSFSCFSIQEDSSLVPKFAIIFWKSPVSSNMDKTREITTFFITYWRDFLHRMLLLSNSIEILQYIDFYHQLHPHRTKTHHQVLNPHLPFQTIFRSPLRHIIKNDLLNCLIRWKLLGYTIWNSEIFGYFSMPFWLLDRFPFLQRRDPKLVEIVRKQK